MYKAATASLCRLSPIAFPDGQLLCQCVNFVIATMQYDTACCLCCRLAAVAHQIVSIDAQNGCQGLAYMG